MKKFIFKYIVSAESEEQAKKIFDDDMFTFQCQNDNLSEVMSIDEEE